MGVSSNWIQVGSISFYQIIKHLHVSNLSLFKLFKKHKGLKSCFAYFVKMYKSLFPKCFRLKRYVIEANYKSSVFKLVNKTVEKMYACFINFLLSVFLALPLLGDNYFILSFEETSFISWSGNRSTVSNKQMSDIN